MNEKIRIYMNLVERGFLPESEYFWNLLEEIHHKLNRVHTEQYIWPASPYCNGGRPKGWRFSKWTLK